MTLLSDLARVKALFQARALGALMTAKSGVQMQKRFVDMTDAELRSLESLGATDGQCQQHNYLSARSEIVRRMGDAKVASKVGEG